MIKIFIVSLMLMALGSIAWSISGKDEQVVEPQNFVDANQMVFIDPETGEITQSPSAQDVIEMQNSMLQLEQKKLRSPKAFKGANGMVGVKLNGRFTQSLVATVDSSGEVHLTHRDNQTIQSLNESNVNDALKISQEFHTSLDVAHSGHKH